MLLYALIGLAVLGSVGVCLLTESFLTLAWLWMLPVTLVGIFLLLLALAFGFLCLMCAFVDLNKPQEKDSPFFRKMVTLYVGLILKIARVKVHTRGIEQLPKDGRFLLVANHTHDIDPGILLHVFPNSQLAFIAKREARTMFLVGKVMHRLLCQMINRENDKEALKTIITCIRMIKDDQVSVGVFPEGRIYPDRKLHTFRPGVFKIAQKAGVPVVVVAMHDNSTVLPNLLKLKPSEVHVNLLQVIPAEEVCAANTVELAHRIYEMMAADLGPERVWQGEEENA